MLNIFEVTSFDEFILVFIELSVLVVNLHFMEGVIFDASRMYNISTLCQIGLHDCFFIVGIVIIQGVLVDDGEHRRRLPDDVAGDELAVVADFEQAPVEEAALVELAEVHADVDRAVVVHHHVFLFDLVPGHQLVVVAWDRRRSTQAQKVPRWILS